MYMYKTGHKEGFNWNIGNNLLLFQGFDLNYHNSFKQGVEAYVTAEANLASTTIQSADSIHEGKLSVQADKDKKDFFEDNHAAVVLPFTFAYLPYNDEEVSSVQGHKVHSWIHVIYMVYR